MKKLISPFLPILLSLFIVCCLAACNRAEWTATMTRAVDGDTVVITHENTQFRVRLLGIDAPERKQEWGPAATDYLKQFEGQQVTLRFATKKGTDRYGRLLAFIWVGGENLNEQLLARGLALPYMVPKPWKEQAEQTTLKARNRKAGFWKNGGLEQTPAQWRKAH